MATAKKNASASAAGVVFGPLFTEIQETAMAREQRSESLDSIVTDDSEDPLTCPLTQRLFHDPVILVASGEAPCINQIVAAPRRHC